MSENTEIIKFLSNEISNNLPFLLDSNTNKTILVVICNDMEKCLKLSDNVNDLQIVISTFQLCVSYSVTYKLSDLMNECSKWKDKIYEKLDYFKKENNSKNELIKQGILNRLNTIERIINNPDNLNREELDNAKESLDNFEKEVINSGLDSNFIKDVMYRITMLRESINVSLIIIADMSSVRRLLNNARR